MDNPIHIKLNVMRFYRKRRERMVLLQSFNRILMHIQLTTMLLFF